MIELTEKMAACTEACLVDWRLLAEIIITRLTIFNKRRGNEVSSLLLKRYVDRNAHNKTIHEDILKSFTPLEKKLMNRYG